MDSPRKNIMSLIFHVSIIKIRNRFFIIRFRITSLKIITHKLHNKICLREEKCKKLYVVVYVMIKIWQDVISLNPATSTNVKYCWIKLFLSLFDHNLCMWMITNERCTTIFRMHLIPTTQRLNRDNSCTNKEEKRNNGRRKLD